MPCQAVMLVIVIAQKGVTAPYLFKGTLETPLPFGAVIPLLIYNAKCYVFVRRPSDEMDEAGVLFPSRRE